MNEKDNQDFYLEKEEKFFDKNYYKIKNPDLNSEQVSFCHYHMTGWKEGRDPAEWFSTSLYLSKYSDIKKANIDPFYHFIRYGIKEKRQIFNSNPEFKGQLPNFTETEENVKKDTVDIKYPDLCIVRKLVDNKFYLNIYSDIKGIDDPALHYYLYGWKEGRDPNPDFSTTMFFLANNIQNNKTCPLTLAEIFPELKKFKTRIIYTDNSFKSYQNKANNFDSLINEYSEEIKVCHKLIDNDYYAYKYGIIDKAAEHFCIYGYKLGFNPNSWFNIDEYRKNNNELINGNINPLYYYIKKGRYKKQIQPTEIKSDYILHKAVPLSVSNVLKDYTQYIENPIQPSNSTEISENLISNYIKQLNYIKEIDSKGSKSNINTQIFKNFSKLNNANSDNDLILHWLIPDFGIGGGGHMTIFRTIRYLELNGCICKIWIINKGTHNNTIDAYFDLINYYQVINAKIEFISMDHYPINGSAIVCTSWETVEWANKICRNQKLFYFVQDYEKQFYAVGTKNLLAEATYHANLNCICASPWLDKIMREKYKRNSCAFMLGFNADEYYIMDKVKKFSEIDNKKHIAVYSRIFTERRAVELILIGLHILGNKRSDFVIHFFGGGLQLEIAPFDYVLHGNLSSEQLCKLYNSCDIGICFSTTNYSLVPQEMMACGLPLLEQEGDNTISIFPPDIINLVKPYPSSIAEKLNYMLDHLEILKKTAERAYEWVKNHTWNNAFKEILKFITKTIGYNESELNKKTLSKQDKEFPFASVVIPIYNPNEEFKKVLNRVCSQQTPWYYEIILIDSSTKTEYDLNYYKKFSERIRYLKIDNRDFQHGKTRNLGVELSNAKYVAFITQDALPYDNNWLYNLVTVLDKNSNVAIAFGRHYPYPDASPFVKRDINNHFNNILNQPVIMNRDTNRKLYESKNVQWLQKLYYYSDNNSCLNKDYWKKIPMRNIDYGEDQILAMDMINAGYSKIFVNLAAVYHSHNFNEEDTFTRSKTEKHFFEDFFGWNLIHQYKSYEELEDTLNKMDTNYAKENGIDEETLKKQLTINKAKALGYFS